jgi:hypothetical protein
MRTTLLIVITGLTLAAAGCAKPADDTGGVATAQTGKPTASASASATVDPDAPLKFAQCMRSHGMTWFPDPQPGGRMNIKTPKGMDPKKMDAAQEACKQFAPDGGAPPKMSAEDLERARKMSQCMRDNGVPGFPDPDPDGGIRIDGRKLGMGPGDAAFDKAQAACDKFQPGAHTESGQGA